MKSNSKTSKGRTSRNACVLHGHHSVLHGKNMRNHVGVLFDYVDPFVLRASKQDFLLSL